MTIGKRIQEERKKVGYTQRKLAEVCGLATGTIQQYELDKRKPNIETLQKIAYFLNVSIEYLSTGKKPEIPSYKWTSDIFDMIELYTKLNYNGKIEAQKRVQELTEIPRYRKDAE